MSNISTIDLPPAPACNHSLRCVKALLVPAAAMIVLLLSSCKRPAGQKIVTAIPALASQEPYLTERAGMEETAAGLGIKVDWIGPSDSDQQRQVDLITEATSENRYGIVLNPAGTNATSSAVQAALSKKVPVVVARDRLSLPAQDHLSFVLQDNATGAALVCRRLKEIGARGGKVVILGLEPDSRSSVARFDALEQTMQRDCSEIKVVDRVIAPYSSGYVQVMAERAMHRHPDLLALIALNNRAGLGAAAALNNGGNKNKTRVIVFDESFPLLLRLRRGEIDSVVAQDMRTMGSIALLNIDADRKGLPYQHEQTLKPMLITAENIDLESTQKALTLNWGLR